MTSTWEVYFEHDELYYTLHVFHNKIMLMMTLLKIYVLFSSLISYQCLLHSFQGCQIYSLIMIYDLIEIFCGVVLHDALPISNGLVARNYIFIMLLRKNWCIDRRNKWLQYETFILSMMDSIIHCTYWTIKYCWWWLY